MADEISITARFGITNGNYDPGTWSVSNLQIDQTSQGAADGVQEIGTSEETLSTGDLSTRGVLMMRNLDDTNYVQWGFATGDYGGRMRAGETAGPFRTESAQDIYLIADTAACNVQFRWLED